MNDMSHELRKAGYSSSFERLIQIAQDAWSRSPGKESSLARHRYVQDRLSGDLTYEMMRKWEPEALRRSINYLLASTEPKENSSVVAFLSTGGGHEKRDAHYGGAPVTSSPDPAQAGGGGHLRGDTHELIAPANNDASPLVPHRSEPANTGPTPKTGLPAAPSISILADKQQAAALARLRTMQRLSKLDEVRVEWPGFSKPIGDCTVAEVKRWIEIRQSDARRASRDVRFASVLVANLTSNAVLRDYWRNPAEVEKIYASAEAENAA
jgi:hypothetical protein